MKNARLFVLALILFGGLGLSAQKVETTFHVSGVCDMCKARIEKATDVDGIVFSEWDKEKQELFIVYRPDEMPIDSVHTLIQNAGHDTEKGKASDENYDKVHGCCRYRDSAVIEKHK